MSPPGKDSETEWDHNTKEGREPNKEAPRTVGKKKSQSGVCRFKANIQPRREQGPVKSFWNERGDDLPPESHSLTKVSDFYFSPLSPGKGQTGDCNVSSLCGETSEKWRQVDKMTSRGSSCWSKCRVNDFPVGSVRRSAEKDLTSRGQNNDHRS